jgi:hypothetical protein
MWRALQVRKRATVTIFRRYASAPNLHRRKRNVAKPSPNIPYVDFTRCATMPIRDMHNDGRIVFFVDVYGWDQNNIAVIPGGSEPAYKAVTRLGLDPNRYQAVFWDSDGSGVIMGGEMFKPVSAMRPRKR